MLILALLPVALSATANCVTDPPEIGDIGPGSVLVCKELAHSFPSAALAVEGRSIHSPTEVTVMASVDGRPIPLSYTLAGFTWSFNDGGTRTADATAPRSGPSIPH
jgi:hypothetical protein